MAETLTPNYGLSQFDQGDNPPVCTAAKLNANWTKIDALLGGTSKAKLISLEATPAGTVVLQADVTGDTQQRFTMTCDAVMSWSSGSVAADVTWRRAGVGTFQQSAGVTPQILHQYNTTDSDSAPANYERTFVGWSGNVWSIIQQKLGTGVSRDFAVRGGNNLFLGVGATNYWKIDSATGHFFAVTDNSNDIGSSGAVRPRNIYVGTQFLAVQGSTANPPYGFAASTNSGMLFSGANTQIIWAVAGTPTMGMTSTTTMLGSGQAFAWASAADPTGGTADTILRRGASGIVSQSNGANVQAYRLYNTTDSDTAPANYERLNIIWSGNVCYLQTASAGTGVVRDIGMSATGGEGWRFKASGHLFVTFGDNALDIGASGANRPRSIYAGTSFLGADGSVSTPSFSFGSATGLGLFKGNGSYVVVTGGTGLNDLALGAGGVIVSTNGALTFVNSTNVITGTQETALIRDGTANTVAFKNGANAQTVRIYGTTTGNKYILATHNGSNGQIDVSAGGILLGGTATVIVLQSLVEPSSNNSIDLGVVTTNAWRNIFVGTSVVCASAAAQSTTGAVWYDSTQTTLSCYEAGVQVSKSGTIFTATNGVALNNSNAETSMLGTGQGTKTLAANFLVIGKTIRVTIRGFYTTGATPQTITFRFKLGGSVVCSLAGFAPPVSQTNSGFVLEAVFTCRTTGAGGSVIGEGSGTFQATTLTADAGPFLVNTSTLATNTTTTNAIDFTFQTAAADAAATYTTTNIMIEVLN